MATTSRFKSSAELRKFGLVMFAGFGLLGGLFLWRRGLEPATWALLGLAALFLLVGLALPKVLGPIEWAWMKLAGLLGFVMTRVILTLTFFLAITPLGLLRRLLGQDSLVLKKRPDAESYWVAVEKDGPGTRPESPF